MDDYKTVVARVNVVRQRRLRLLILVCILSMAGGAYYWGYNNGFDDRVPLVLDEMGLKGEISKLETRLALNDETVRRLRNELSSQERQASELERELVFYRDIMSSAEDVSSVKVRDPDMTWDPESRRLEYRAVVQRLAPGTQSYRGKLRLVVLDADETVLDQSRFGTPEHDLGFKYFQRISGIIDVPDTFIPAELRFAIELRSPRKRKYQQIFQWSDMIGVTQ